MIKVLIGNIFQSKAHTLVNTVNCVGVMGKGIAEEFKLRYPEMYKHYVQLCNTDQVRTGIPYHYTDIFGTSIINFPTKNHWRALSRLDDIVRGIDYFIAKYKQWGIRSVAFPPLGCGNGGLEWESVGPVMYQKLLSVDIPVELYAPFGTPQKYLTEMFLSGANINNLEHIKGKKPLSFKPEWSAILEVLHNLERQPYVKPVGRTIFQKICYVMQESGIDLGLKFSQGSYGPYSVDVKSILKVMANSNIVFEQQSGKMTALRTGPQFQAMREEYKGTAKLFTQQIQKVTDLFMRIKDSTQAEEVTTVLFVANKLEKQKQEFSESDIYREVLQWKRRWDEPDKKRSLALTIRNLAVLTWIKAEFSDSLAVYDCRDT